MHSILRFRDINTIAQHDALSLAGGKAARLAELRDVMDIKVPDGFCVTTDVFRTIIGHHANINALLDQLSAIQPENRKAISEISSKIRQEIEGISIPKVIGEEIVQHLEEFGIDNAYAVRSSATAEDLPSASFAGQQDTYLNITGTEAILKHMIKCWASLFTDRAVTYRMQNGFGHKHIYLCVIIQHMILPEVSGIMFTADPVNSNRKMLSIDAGYGLGEALVSGMVNADLYKVLDGHIVEKKISDKKLAVYATEHGGTREQELEREKRLAQVLNDEQILELEQIGRVIEQHFGCPQDIEWCMAGNRFYIVQSRPITTLFPIPEQVKETAVNAKRIYISVGHNQMMTDAIKPLGLSFFLMTTPAKMSRAGGRLFVDVTDMLASSSSRKTIIDNFGKSDPLIKDALMTVSQREDLVRLLPDDHMSEPVESKKSIPALNIYSSVENDPHIAEQLISSSQASLAELRQQISTKSGTELFDFIRDDMPQLKKDLFSQQSLNLIMTTMNASMWINEHMKEWLGEKNAADILAQSVANNITSEMGLALLDVADVIRPYPEVRDYLKQVRDDDFLEKLPQFAGGQESREAIIKYLDKYGMRCAGEIDITRPRWSEHPVTLVSMILNNINNFEPGEGSRKFEQGKQEALKKEVELLDRLSQLPDGQQKAEETKQMISLVRNFSGYREYPKYGMVNRYYIYKQALMKEAAELVHAHVIDEQKDIFYLTFEELREVVYTKQLDKQIIGKRKEEFKSYEKLTPPRVITSEGEIITGKYTHEDLPDGAIAGLPVSSGVIEGRARVIHNMEDAELEDGDILVTTFTDPSWTPLFISVKGLVTEVGGLMTHGAVIAREYGLPAVVGVENATRLITNGQNIRVNGTDGYVELL